MTDEEKQSKEHKKRKRGRRAHGTGSVFQRIDRKGKQWVAQLVLENGKTRQRYFWTQAEAADALNEMLYEQKRGMLATGPKQTVKQYLEDWLEHVQGKSAKTIHHIHGVLHKALAQAVRWRLVSRNVCDDVELPRLTRYEHQTLTAGQAQALLEIARGHRLEVLLALALTTGMRHGELLGLHWQDMNFDNGTLQVR